MNIKEAIIPQKKGGGPMNNSTDISRITLDEAWLAGIPIDCYADSPEDVIAAHFETAEEYEEYLKEEDNG